LAVVLARQSLQRVDLPAELPRPRGGDLVPGVGPSAPRLTGNGARTHAATVDNSLRRDP